GGLAQEAGVLDGQEPEARCQRRRDGVAIYDKVLRPRDGRGVVEMVRARQKQFVGQVCVHLVGQRPNLEAYFGGVGRDFEDVVIQESSQNQVRRPCAVGVNQATGEWGDI